MTKHGTKIEWTHRPGFKGETWNPLRGTKGKWHCVHTSPGCQNCYAERLNHRFKGPKYRVGADQIRLDAKVLEKPLRWTNPRSVFVASMSDLFLDEVPATDIAKVFAVMANCPQHQFIVLTKRVARAATLLCDPMFPFSVQRAWDEIQVDAEMHHMVEEWRPIPEWEEYEVSNFGEIRRGGRLLKRTPNKARGGYLQVGLCKNGRPITKRLHSLVLSAFVGPAPIEHEVGHRNGQRADNRIANLSWVTRLQNMEASVRHGTAGAWMKSRATLEPAEVRRIRRLRNEGWLLDEIAAEVGSTRQQVSAICLGNIFKPAELRWPLPNVWIGVSVENQKYADERIPLLLQIPTVLRFVSAEPLLGPMDLREHLYPRAHESTPGCLGSVVPAIDWVICGGESGPGARGMDLMWLYNIMNQCLVAGTPAFVKQVGSVPLIPEIRLEDYDTTYDAWRVEDDFFRQWPQRTRFGNRTGKLAYNGRHILLKDRKGGDWSEWPHVLQVRQFPELPQ